MNVENWKLIDLHVVILYNAASKVKLSAQKNIFISAKVTARKKIIRNRLSISIELGSLKFTSLNARGRRCGLNRLFAYEYRVQIGLTVVIVISDYTAIGYILQSSGGCVGERASDLALCRLRTSEQHYILYRREIVMIIIIIMTVVIVRFAQLVLNKKILIYLLGFPTGDV